MARKKGPPIGESVRDELSKNGLIDNRYKNALEGFWAKEERRFVGKKKG
jgi:lambda repressor-like predicted transcriptional regulator